MATFQGDVQLTAYFFKYERTNERANEQTNKRTMAVTCQFKFNIISFPFLPHSGCPDLYQVHRRSHMFGGVRYDRATTLRQCQDECLRTRHCLALDWVARPLATAPATASRCFLLFPEVIVELGMAPFRLESTDHYRRMHCASTPMTSATTESVTSPMTREFLALQCLHPVVYLAI